MRLTRFGHKQLPRKYLTFAIRGVISYVPFKAETYFHMFRVNMQIHTIPQRPETAAGKHGNAIASVGTQIDYAPIISVIVDDWLDAYAVFFIWKTAHRNTTPCARYVLFRMSALDPSMQSRTISFLYPSA
jgi:hypothetical protein